MAIATDELSPDKQISQHRLWLDILMEIGILVLVYLVYCLSRGSLDEKATVAFQHARDLIDLEKTLGIFVELDIKSFFLETSFRIDVANYLYTLCYYPSLVLFGIWAYWRHREKYKFMRTVFIISAALAFVVFALYPCAPPRFFDGNHGVENLGFVDTLFTYWDVDEGGIQQFYNPYAAMPSLHQGWTLMIAIGIIWMTKSWFGRVLGALLPIAMFVGIISTANHFILDAVGGAIVIGIAFGATILVSKYLRKIRPQGNQFTSPLHNPMTEAPSTEE